MASESSNLSRGTKIASIARSWLGTPFFPHQAIKGVGCDCVQLARAIYVEAGHAPETVVFPKYSLDGGYHLGRSTVISFLEECGLFSCSWDHEIDRHAPPPTIQPGDLLTFKIGRVPHHVGIAVGGGKFIHAIRDYGVIECDLRDSTWASRLRSVWRPV